MKITSLTALTLTVFSFFTAYLNVEAQGDSTKKVWTISEIVEARDLETPEKKKPRFCRGGAFKPCVCPRDVNKKVQYRPAVKECNGKAAIILSGRYSG